MSPPSRRRGLKSLFYLYTYNYSVASFSEAWIEIVYLFVLAYPISVASFSEAWIEIVVVDSFETEDYSRLLLGGVD